MAILKNIALAIQNLTHPEGHDDMYNFHKKPIAGKHISVKKGNISKVIDIRDINKVYKEGIKNDSFADDENADYDYVKNDFYGDMELDNDKVY